jgi:HPt (histidine-containing phosphotransfer) domain-containing protein
MSAVLSEHADPESVLPVLNRENFKQTAAYLTPDVVATYMRTIADRSESLLRALRDTARPDAALAEAAHALAGSAGLFGFERVAATGRHFERSLLNATSDLPLLTEQLMDALEATLTAITEQTMVAAA